MDRYKFTLPKGKCSYTTKAGKVSLESFTIRETDGRDEEIAQQRAAGDKDRTTQLEHIVMLSLVAVNGETVNVNGIPYLTFNDWNSKSRQFAIKAYNSVNAVSKDESDAFLGAVEAVE